MHDNNFFSIYYRYGVDNKIEYTKITPVTLSSNTLYEISNDYTYAYHSRVFPNYSTNWYIRHTSSTDIAGNIPVPAHEVPSDIRAMNLLLTGD